MPAEWGMLYLRPRSMPTSGVCAGDRQLKSPSRWGIDLEHAQIRGWGGRELKRGMALNGGERR
jgi:hypothetical protein